MKLVNFKSRLLYDLFVVVLLLVGLGYVFSRFVHTGGEWTDNATVRQHITPVNSRVPGFIREIRFDEYQRVHKGDTLVIIEDAEFRLAVAQAEAGLANAMAGQKATSAGIATTSNAVKINEATITEVRVNMENAARDLARFERLLQEDAVTRQQYDNMKTAYESAKARYDQVTSAKAGTQLTVSELGHRLNQSEAGIRLAEAQLEMAKLSLRTPSSSLLPMALWVPRIFTSDSLSTRVRRWWRLWMTARSGSSPTIARHSCQTLPSVPRSRLRPMLSQV